MIFYRTGTSCAEEAQIVPMSSKDIEFLGKRGGEGRVGKGRESEESEGRWRERRVRGEGRGMGRRKSG